MHSRYRRGVQDNSKFCAAFSLVGRNVLYTIFPIQTLQPNKSESRFSKIKFKNVYTALVSTFIAKGYILFFNF